MQQERLSSTVARAGGAVRTAHLLSLGWSTHALRRAVSCGELMRPRKGWLADPLLEPALFDAVSQGVILSCITQAKRLGLWVREESAPHFAARSPRSSVWIETGTLHWSQPVVKREPGAIVDSLPNVLANVAACQRHEDALAIWESALQKKLVTKETLSRLPFRGAARRILQESRPYSDSGLETLVKTRLRWVGFSVIPQAWVHGHRVDFLVDGWLVLQIDGSHHVGPQRTKDIVHDAELVKNGLVVLRMSYEQIVYLWPETQYRIMEILAAGRPGLALRSGAAPPD